jgi:phage I-like protein
MLPLKLCKGDLPRTRRHGGRMVTHRPLTLTAIALNLEGAAAPTWVQLTPPGPAIVGRDGRGWKMTDPAAVAAAFDPTKEPQIDIEHSSQLQAPNGMPAPAMGWIKEIVVRDHALWGRVDWTVEGAAYVTSRAYRYLSPVLAYDWDTNEIQRIVCAGLTNDPNLEMAALNAREQETPEMDAAVLEALGLNPTATPAQAVLAINKLKDDKSVALNAAKTPDPEKFVPKADHALALNRISAFEADAKARTEAEIAVVVDKAIADGKVAPASKEYHLASCRAEGGLGRFTAMVAASPALLPASGLDGKKPEPGAEGGTGVALNAEQQAAALVAKANVLIAAKAKEGIALNFNEAVLAVSEKTQ